MLPIRTAASQHSEFDFRIHALMANIPSYSCAGRRFVQNPYSDRKLAHNLLKQKVWFPHTGFNDFGAGIGRGQTKAPTYFKHLVLFPNQSGGPSGEIVVRRIEVSYEANPRQTLRSGNLV